MFLRTAGALCAIVSLTASLTSGAFAAHHSTVTAFDDIQTRLELKPGQTFLSFMQSQVKPGLDAFEETIKNDPANQAHNYGKLQTNLIAEGAGVAIRIDARNYVFNIGYNDGSDAKNDVKSGRSYGVGPTGSESDPSDLAYLTELEAYLKSEPAATGDFVEALMKVITNCDASGWSKLSEAGQIVATDFVAIYTAELDRHLMVNLDPKTHPWEIDLAAATFVSIFDAQSGLLMKNGALVEGSIKDWWAKGQVGSGIGETRRDRLALQQLIAKSEASSDEAGAIAQLIGASADADLIQGVLLYLNSSNAPADMTGGQGEQLTAQLRSYLVNVQSHAGQIASLQ
jgi:hypothetical protein